MVYFTKKTHRTLMLHPKYLGQQLKETIREQLLQEVEGSSISDGGRVVTVLRVDDEDISRGHIDSLTGFVKFEVLYTAIMFRAFKNEVLDATIKAVTELGFFAEAGPLEVFVPDVHMPGDMTYNPESMCWRAADANEELSVDSSVRLKIISTELGMSVSRAIGSIAESYLGHKNA